MPYQLIDHTGDIGIDVSAPTLEALFAEAGRALFEILVEASPGAGTPEEFPVLGADPPEELREFLAELLYRFSAERKVYGEFAPAPGGIRAVAEPFDPARHAVRTELKAVTWHQLDARREKDGWIARVIFDV